MNTIFQNFSIVKPHTSVYKVQQNSNVYKKEYNSGVSFKGGIETAAQNILKNQKSLAGFGVFMAAGYAALQALANSSSEKNETQDSTTADKSNTPEFMAKIFADKEAEEENLKAKEKEISQLKEQIKLLQEQLVGSEQSQKVVEEVEKIQNTEVVDVQPYKNLTTQPAINLKQVGFMQINYKNDPNNARRQKILEQSKTTGTESTESKIFFKKEGTVSENLSENIDFILQFFENFLYKQYKTAQKTDVNAKAPRWKCNKPTPIKITRMAIIKEIEAQSVSQDLAYKNIKEEHAPALVNIINKEPRFHQCFDVHATLRLIDRYVNFNADESFESQITRIIDKLSELIQNECENGVHIEKYDMDGYISPNIIIDVQNFDEEAIQIFGTKNLVIGISENKNYNGPYIPKYNWDKTAIISTLFSSTT